MSHYLKNMNCDAETFRDDMLEDIAWPENDPLSKETTEDTLPPELYPRFLLRIKKAETFDELPLFDSKLLSYGPKLLFLEMLCKALEKGWLQKSEIQQQTSALEHPILENRKKLYPIFSESEGGEKDRLLFRHIQIQSLLMTALAIAAPPLLPICTA